VRGGYPEAQALRGRTPAVPAKADGNGMEPALSEEVQEVLVPAPRGVPATMDEQQRHRMGCGATALLDDLLHQTQRLDHRGLIGSH
jgi:hypothetical protein